MWSEISFPEMIAPEALCFYECGLLFWIEERKLVDTIVSLTQIEFELAYVIDAWSVTACSSVWKYCECFANWKRGQLSSATRE